MRFELSGQTCEVDVFDLWSFLGKLPDFDPLQLIAAVSTYLQQQGLNVGCAGAWQVYRTVIHIRDRFKHASEIAYWYKVDPFKLNEVERFSLAANLSRVQCQDRIFRGDYEPTDYEGVYALYKAAYDDEDLAQKAKTEAFKRYIDKKTKPPGQ